jgi:3-hydroxyacyl-[acyl-carrier-protein] dehydratase
MESRGAARQNHADGTPRVARRPCRGRKGSVLPPDTLAELIRRLEEYPILPDDAGMPVVIGPAALERLLPQRAPMLLLDAIEAVDLRSRSVRGRRHLAATDCAFAGHFPEEPVYPFPFVIEAIGQLAFTMLQFTNARHTAAPADETPPRVRAVHIHCATGIESFVPGDTMMLHAQVVDSHTTMLVAGQAWRNGTLAAFAVLEMYVVAAPTRDQQGTIAVRRRAEHLPHRMHGGPLGHLALEGFLD